MFQQICRKLVASERRACKILGQARSTQRHHSLPLSDEKRLTEDIITLATKYGRYGYSRVEPGDKRRRNRWLQRPAGEDDPEEQDGQEIVRSIA